MGSCTRIVDDSQVLNEYAYDAWGNVVNQKEIIKNRFKFNGQYSPTKICGANAKHLSFALAKSDESSPTKICGANAKHLSFALAKSDESSLTKICGANAKHLSFALAKSDES